MIDALSALSLYRQLEALEQSFEKAGNSVADRWGAAYMNQGSFNEILKQITDQCVDAPEFLRSFSHIEPVRIQKGVDRSVVPRFMAQVGMLKQAIHALLEWSLSAEQKSRMGFV